MSTDAKRETADCRSCLWTQVTLQCDTFSSNGVQRTCRGPKLGVKMTTVHVFFLLLVLSGYTVTVGKTAKKKSEVCDRFL